MRRSSSVACSIACTIVLAVAAPAVAHERRAVGGVALTVGWGTEPAYAGVQNSVQVRVADGGGTPITSGVSLRADVSFASEQRTLALEPAFVVGRSGEPGDYRAWLVPTRAGTYAFRIYGSVGRTRVDQRFTCSERTFDCVGDPSELHFPARDPSAADLAQRLERAEARLIARASDASGDAGLARTLAIAALALAVIAVLVALGRRRGDRRA